MTALLSPQKQRTTDHASQQGGQDHGLRDRIGRGRLQLVNERERELTDDATDDGENYTDDECLVVFVQAGEADHVVNSAPSSLRTRRQCGDNPRLFARVLILLYKLQDYSSKGAGGGLVL